VCPPHETHGRAHGAGDAATGGGALRPGGRPGRKLGPAQLSLLQPLRLPDRPHGARHRRLPCGDLLQPADVRSVLLGSDLAAAQGSGVPARVDTGAQCLAAVRHCPPLGRSRRQSTNRMVLPGLGDGRDAGRHEHSRNRDELRRQCAQPAGLGRCLADRAVSGTTRRFSAFRLAGRRRRRFSDRGCLRLEIAVCDLRRRALRRPFRV
jgi:hypothetical protein